MINASGFDPSLFHDSDGKKYWLNMVWDHRPHKHPFLGIVLQPFDPVENRLTGKPELIFKGSEIGLTEGPHLYQRNDWYYLLTAEGGTEYEHAVTLARSRNLLGPYELHPENPILTSNGHPNLDLQKAGHASLVETQNRPMVHASTFADARYLIQDVVTSVVKRRFSRLNGGMMIGFTSSAGVIHQPMKWQLPICRLNSGLKYLRELRLIRFNMRHHGYRPRA